MTELNLIMVRHHGTWLELMFKRPEEESKTDFFRKVVQAADGMHGEAAWNGASDDLAIIFIREIK